MHIPKYKKILEHLSLKKEYLIPRNEIFSRFHDYDKLSRDQKDDLWDWLYSYIQNIDWPRKNAYVLYFELINDETISDRFSSDFDQYYSMIIGDGTPTEYWLRFKGEPIDLNLLDNYISSQKWLADD